MHLMLLQASCVGPRKFLVISCTFGFQLLPEGIALVVDLVFIRLANGPSASNPSAYVYTHNSAWRPNVPLILKAISQLKDLHFDSSFPVML